jgi:hypothetical protein
MNNSELRLAGWMQFGFLAGPAKLPHSVGSASDEIISTYAQPAMKSFPQMLNKQRNRFLVCSASDDIVSALAHHTVKCQCKNSQNYNAG